MGVRVVPMWVIVIVGRSLFHFVRWVGPSEAAICRVITLKPFEFNTF